MPKILVNREEPIAVVQLNRPEVLNAQSTADRVELVTALEQLDGDDAIRCIVLTGNAKAFSSGWDLKSAPAESTLASMLKSSDTALWERFGRIRTPIVAAVSGYAVGGGLLLAMSCDIIVASATAQFGLPEINYGFIDGTNRLTRTVGKYVAMELALTGRRIKADEAKAIGLVVHVYPATSWLEDAKALARTIAEKPPLAAQFATEIIEHALNSTLDAGLLFERLGASVLFLTEDRKEGIDAFVNKRKPIFKGR